MTLEKRIIAKQLELFKSFSRIISSTRNLDEILTSTVDLIKDLLEVERCSIFLVDEGGETLSIKAAAGIPRSEWKEIKIAMGESIVGYVAKTAQPLLVRDISSLRDLPICKDGDYKTDSFISAPIVIDSVVRGVINVNNKLSKVPFTETDLELIVALEGLISMVIDHCCLFVSTENLQRYLHNILDNLILGVVVLDKNNDIDLYNKIARNFLGYGEDADLAGQNIIDFFSDEDKDKVQRLIDRCVSNGETVIEEIILTGVEGEERSIGITAYQLDIDIDPTINVVLAIEDLSVKKELLELKHLDEVKSNIISIVSHELRTPLTSIRGAVHLLKTLKADVLGESHMGLIKIIDRNVNRLNNLISDLLDVMHIENNTLPSMPQPTDIEPILDGVITKFEDLINEKCIEVHFSVKGATHPIDLDREQASKIFDHLLDNAVKFSPEKGKIWIEAVYEGNQVEIKFRDNGIGVDREFREKIFEKLYQVDSTMTRKVGGTGLGLYIVKSLTELNNGHVEVSDEWDEGAEIVVRFPSGDCSAQNKAPGQ